jgi:hypothetical protein
MSTDLRTRERQIRGRNMVSGGKERKKKGEREREGEREKETERESSHTHPMPNLRQRSHHEELIRFFFDQKRKPEEWLLKNLPFLCIPQNTFLYQHLAP